MAHKKLTNSWEMMWVFRRKKEENSSL